MKTRHRNASKRAAGRAMKTPGRGSERRAYEGELILGGGSFIDPQDRATQRFVFSEVDLGTGRIGLIYTDFLPHGIAIDPLNAHRLVTFQKIGAGCCEIDLATRQVSRTIPPTEGRWFYGHGAFSADGRLLYSTETVNSEQRGVIGVRDAATLEYLGEFPTFGENPHDCHLIDAGKVLLVTNGGGAIDTPLRPCVTWVDVASQRLLDKQELGSERFNTGHLSLWEGEGLVVVSAPRKGLTEKDLGAVSMRRGQDPLRTMAEPAAVAARMYGEALSVAIHEPSATAAVTHPGGNMVTFWSMRTLTLAKMVELPFARGVTLTRDGRTFVVSYGLSADLVQIAPDSLKIIADTNISQSYLSGSHLFNWTRLTGQTSLLAA
jgi:hypothetical protein